VLVLGRRLGEFILIDNRIVVMVIKSEEGSLRLAIDAPPDVKIVRGEIKEKALKQKRHDDDINK
jgi:carbon storage regulator